MGDRLTRLEQRVEEIGLYLSRLSKRVERLEGRRGALPDDESTAPTASSGAEAPAATKVTDVATVPSAWSSLAVSPAPLVSFAGRTMIVLAGAYGLRAITDYGYVPRTTGVALGLAYAAVWLVMVLFHARKERTTSALFFGFAASLVAYPLIWETTARFELVQPAVGAALLTIFFLASLAIAVWAHLPRWAWATTIFALATAIALFVGTRDLISYAIAVLVIAAATEAASIGGRWLGLRWPVAIAVDLVLLLTTIIATRPEGVPDSYPPIGALALTSVLIALPVVYLTSTGARTLVRTMSVKPFEIVQATVALAVGIGGAARVAAVTGGSIVAIGGAASVLGAACYLATFSLADRRKGHQRNFFFYSSLGGLLVLIGTAMMARQSALAIGWVAIGLLVVVLGRLFDRQTLRFHGSIFVCAAAFASGLPLAAARRLASSPLEGWPPVSIAGYLAATALFACYVLLVTTEGGARDIAAPRRVPRTIIAALSCWSLAGLLVGALMLALRQEPGPGADRAIFAVVRTGVLASSAVGLAWAGRHVRFRELGWLVYPVLVAGGLKLLTEDFFVGRAVTLFASFALFGTALVLAPRLGRHHPPADRPRRSRS